MKSFFKMLALTVTGSCLLVAAVSAVSADSVVPASGTIPPASPVAVIQKPANLQKPFQAVTVTAKTIDEKTDLYDVVLNIPVIGGMPDEPFQAQLNDRIKQRALEDLDIIKKQSAEDAATAKEDGYTFNPYVLNIDYTLRSDGGQAAGGKLSLTVQTLTYMGGAHGMTRVDTYNVNNGKEAELLTLEDALGNDFKQQAELALKKAVAAEPNRFFEESVKEISMTKDQAFYIADGKVYLVYSQSEIGPYAAGVIEIQV